MEPIDLDLEESELELPSEPMHLNMGPAHPAMHGTVRCVLELSGETIVKADVQIGYLHRGFEKMCERGTWTQVFPYVDRANYVSPIFLSLCWRGPLCLQGSQDPTNSWTLWTIGYTKVSHAEFLKTALPFGCLMVAVNSTICYLMLGSLN